MTEPQFTPPTCFVCNEPATQVRPPGEMCTTCATSYDKGDVKMLLRRNRFE